MILWGRGRALLPVVVFCFSKKRVDLLADNLSNLDLATAAEKSEIQVFCERALGRLCGADRELPQILRVREMLKRGLGVHHAGARTCRMHPSVPLESLFDLQECIAFPGMLPDLSVLRQCDLIVGETRTDTRAFLDLATSEKSRPLNCLILEVG